MTARFILACCERFGCLPSQLLAEPDDLFGLLALEQLAAPADGGGVGW